MLDKFKSKIKETTAEVVAVIRVSPDIQKQRFEICLSCEHLYKTLNTCKQCGCFMPAKTWIPGVKCPLGKWHKEGEAE